MSPVKNKTKRAGQKGQYHRKPLLFFKSQNKFIILNLPFTYNGIFPSEYFHDQPKVTLLSKTKQFCTDVQATILYALSARIIQWLPIW